MKTFVLPIAENIHGANALDLFYQGLNASWPEYGYTKDNSTLVLIQPYGERDGDAILQICKKDDPTAIESFIFHRYPITDIVSNPAFNTDELEAIDSLTTSEQLLEFIAVKYNVNFTADDIWININDIDLTGGTTPPNWLMKSRYDSLFWYGELVVWLHPGP